MCDDRYIENICKNPTEEKYRKIKLSNKVFQVWTFSVRIEKTEFKKLIHSHFVVLLIKEKVSVIEGSREYLQAVGFEITALPVDGEGNGEVNYQHYI